MLKIFTNKNIYILVLTLFLGGCLIKQGPYSLEEVEDERIKFRKGDRKALVTLIDIYKDKNQPYDVRIESLRALAESRHPKIISAIQSSVKNASLIEMEMMLEAIDIIIKYDDASSTDSLIYSLKSTEKKVMQIRESIINAIGENGSEDEIYTLLELYEVSKANHARMNKLLTLTLGGIGDDRAIPILMEIAGNEELDIYLRNRAIEILARKQSPELVDFFVEMLGEPGTRDKVNEYAFNVLDSDGQNDKMVYTLLESYQISRHKYYSLMNSLIKNMSDYQNPAIKPIFLEVATTDEFPRTLRIKSIRALSKFQDTNVVDDLIKILEHPANYIYYNEIIAVIKALGVYDKFKSDIRKAAYTAYKNEIENENNLGER